MRLAQAGAGVRGFPRAVAPRPLSNANDNVSGFPFAQTPTVRQARPVRPADRPASPTIPIGPAIQMLTRGAGAVDLIETIINTGNQLNNQVDPILLGRTLELNGWQLDGNACSGHDIMTFFVTGFPAGSGTQCWGNQTAGPQGDYELGEAVPAGFEKVDGYGNFRWAVGFPDPVPKMDNVQSFMRTVSQAALNGQKLPEYVVKPVAMADPALNALPRIRQEYTPRTEPLGNPFIEMVPQVVTTSITPDGVTTRVDRSFPRVRNDRKMRLAVPGLVKQLTFVTEIGDVVDCLWNNLPSNVRRKRHNEVKARNKARGNPPPKKKPKVPKIWDPEKKKWVKGIEDKKVPGRGITTTDHSQTISLTDKIADIIMHGPDAYGQAHPNPTNGVPATRGENAVNCIALNEAKDRGIGQLGQRAKAVNKFLGDTFGGRSNLGLGPAI